MKYPFSILLFIVCVFVSTKGTAQSYNTYYGGIVGNCSNDSITQHLIDFENLGVKEPGTVALNNTLNWLIDKYVEYGYTDIVIDTFTYSGFESYNLIVTKTGLVYPDTYFVIDGHYDTKTGSGTNDNGSGTAIILETARLMQSVSTEYSVKFIHFSMEEVGLVGSYHYVNNVAFPTGMDIRVLLNIDEVGGINGMVNNTIVCERDESNPSAANAASAAFTDTLATCVSLYSNLLTEISYAYASDYMPFQAQDYVITGLFEKNYSPYAHTVNDSIGNMDVPYVYEIAKASVGASLYFAVAYEAIGVEELEDDVFIVYPNPTSEFIKIKTKKGTSYPTHYQLINYLGETVKQGAVNSTNYQLSVKDLPAGIYTIQLTYLNKVSNKKLLVTK